MVLINVLFQALCIEEYFITPIKCQNEKKNKTSLLHTLIRNRQEFHAVPKAMVKLSRRNLLTSFLWMSRCCFKFEAVMKRLSQMSHLNGFSLVWSFVCRCKFDI